MSASSSTLVSPALRPRISPSIKPLLPEGSSLNSQTHALLLASKSNYQNLLEGNHLPGVNYPDSLSTGLTSKRTSHKVAEQGRRNRINEALREMQALLPRPAPSSSSSSTSLAGAATPSSNGNTNNTKDSTALATSDSATPDLPAVNDADRADKEESAAAKASGSKAATVESANEYIRKLQRENAALLRIQREHEALKRRLASLGASASLQLGSDADADLGAAVLEEDENEVNDDVEEQEEEEEEEAEQRQDALMASGEAVAVGTLSSGSET